MASQSGDRRVYISKKFDDSRREEVDACCMLGRACQAMGDMSSASEALKRALQNARPKKQAKKAATKAGDKARLRKRAAEARKGSARGFGA